MLIQRMPFKAYYSLVCCSNNYSCLFLHRDARTGVLQVTEQLTGAQTATMRDAPRVATTFAPCHHAVYKCQPRRMKLKAPLRGIRLNIYRFNAMKSPVASIQICYRRRDSSLCAGRTNSTVAHELFEVRRVSPMDIYSTLHT